MPHAVSALGESVNKKRPWTLRSLLPSRGRQKNRQQQKAAGKPEINCAACYKMLQPMGKRVGQDKERRKAWSVGKGQATAGTGGFRGCIPEKLVSLLRGGEGGTEQVSGE